MKPTPIRYRHVVIQGKRVRLIVPQTAEEANQVIEQLAKRKR